MSRKEAALLMGLDMGEEQHHYRGGHSSLLRKVYVLDWALA